MRIFAILSVLLGAAVSPALAQTYDATASFNGVQGSGGFFHGAFTPSGFAQLAVNTGCPTSTICLRTTDASGPLVAKSVIGSFTAGTITYPGNALVARPGPTASYEIVWIPPSAGFWQIDAVFSRTDVLPDIAAVTPFLVPVRGRPSTLEPFGVLVPGRSPFRYSKMVFLNPGGAFGFDLNAANGSFAADSTAFRFTVSRAVPEPASWAMLVAGFGLTGTMLRRSAKSGVRTKLATSATQTAG